MKRLQKARGAKEAKQGELRDLKEQFSYHLLEELAAGADLDELLGEYLGDDYRKRLEEELATMDRMEEGIEPEDIKNSLKEYVDKDLIEIDENGVKITPKGSDKLAKYVLQAPVGEPERREHGGQRDKGRRLRHERRLREPEARVRRRVLQDRLEASLLSALEKGKKGTSRIEFDEEDLMVRESIVDTKLCVGLIVDESGSMSGDKIHAAMDISLALSELIRRNARDRLRLFLFSNQVREMAQWDMLNVTFAGGTTDIRARDAAVQDRRPWGRRADKQVYLITDTEPNCEDGKYIGFEKATLGVLREAIIYQREGHHPQYHHARQYPSSEGVCVGPCQAEPGEGLLCGAQGTRQGRDGGLSTDEKEAEAEEGGLEPRCFGMGLIGPIRLIGPINKDPLNARLMARLVYGACWAVPSLSYAPFPPEGV